MDQKTITHQADAAKDAAKELYDGGRQMLKQGVRSAKDYAETASEKSREAMERSREAFVATQDWAKENPWMTVGMIAGLGLILGLLIGNNRR